jgi:hypothetical protein
VESTLSSLVVVGSRTGPPPEESTQIGGPNELLDRWDGAIFAELLDLELRGDLLLFCSSVLGLNVCGASDPADLQFCVRLEFQDGNPFHPRSQGLAAVPGDHRICSSSCGDEIQPLPVVSTFHRGGPSSSRSGARC